MNVRQERCFVGACDLRDWRAVGTVLAARVALFAASVGCTAPEPAPPPADGLAFADLGGVGGSDAAGAGVSLPDAVKDSAASGDAAASDVSVCADGTARCVASGRELCQGGAWKSAPCAAKAPICADGECRVCAAAAVRCAPAQGGSSTSTKVEQCSADGSGWAVLQACADGELCVQAACVPCQPGAARCEGGARQVCSADGKAWKSEPCPSDKLTCENGKCYVCAPDKTFCAAPEPGQVTPTVVLTCDSAGVDTVSAQTCAPPTACLQGACRICVPGETRCTASGQLESCIDDGQTWLATPCPAAANVCVDGACLLCKPNSTFCPVQYPGLPPSNKVLKCNAKGTQASVAEVCGDGLVCALGACNVCAPGYSACLGDAVLSCAPAGVTWQGVSSCAAVGTSCQQGKCQCQPGTSVCAPAALGLAGSNQVATCSASGDSATLGESCGPTAACVSGTCQACVPGAHRCQGSKALACKGDGSGWQLSADCSDNGLVCSGGQCIDVCDPKVPNPTSQGCHFIAAALPNGAVAPDEQPTMALTLTNATLKSAQVTVSTTDSPGPDKTTQLTIAAKSSQTLVLPLPQWGLPVAKPPAGGLSARLFRVQSDAPLSAMQLSPAQPEVTKAADSALLLPVGALGKSYRAVLLPQLTAKGPTWLAMAAPGTTAVAVQVSAPTKATVWPGGKLLKAGDVTTLQLAPGTVTLVATDALLADLTGTTLSADQPFAVWAGASLTSAPNTMKCVNITAQSGGVGTCLLGGAACTADSDCPQVCCGDHLQEQLWPLASWSKVVPVVALALRDPQSKESDVIRVVADKPATVVSTLPPQGPPVTLGPGAFVEYQGKADFVIVASQPVGVMQWMTSSQQVQVPDKSPGDPTMLWVPPGSAAVLDTVFWVPTGFSQHRLNLAGPPDAAPILDGAALAATTKLAGSGWSAFVVSVSAGQHTLSVTRPVTATLYGWADGVSYGHSLGRDAP